MTKNKAFSTYFNVPNYSAILLLGNVRLTQDAFTIFSSQCYLLYKIS